MFCTDCGKEIKEGMVFCPGCGRPVNAAGQAKGPQVVYMNASAAPKKKMSGLKRIFITVLVLVIAFVALRYAFQQAELVLVRSEVEAVMNEVTEGPDAEIAKSLVDFAIDKYVPTDFAKNFIKNRYDGNDIQDIYHALMKYLDYEIRGVEKVESGHYRITIYMSNINNTVVIGESVAYFVSNYQGKSMIGKIWQGVKDLTSDKSEAIAGVFEDIADHMYSLNDSDYFVSGTYVIDIINEDGEWTAYPEGGFLELVKGCAGFSFE